MNASFISLIGLGFILGLKHATDADHIVAVSTMLGEERRILRSCWIGVFWGVGHTFSLILAGLLVVVQRIPLSPSASLWLETGVAAMLVFLGARVLVQSLSPTRRLHHHGSTAHTHWHVAHSGWRHFGLRPFLVGMVHGAAGSAALTLLVLSTISSTATALIYIVVFGVGSIAGMLAISLLIALPMSWAGHRLNAVLGPVQMAAGLFSCIFGIYLGYSLWS